MLISFLRNSLCSPFKKVNSIFSQNEYQKEVGNLSHIHLILQVDWKSLTQSEEQYMDNLIRADVMAIVKSEEISHLIDEGIITSIDYVKYVHQMQILS